MSDIFGGGGEVQTQSSSDKAPWAGVQPYLLQQLGAAQNLYNQNPGGYNYQANLPQATQQAWTQGQAAANNPNGLVAQGQNALGYALDPAHLNPESNPAFAQSVQNALGRAGTAFEGQYGGPAGLNLNNSGYQQNLAEGLGRAATQAYANQYNQNETNALNAALQAPGLQAANASQLYNIGQQQQQLGLSQFQSPWNQLGNYTQAIGGGLQGFGSQTGTNQTPYFTNPLGSLGGAALGIGQLYGSGALNGIGSMFGTGGAFGPALGAGGGVMAGLGAEAGLAEIAPYLLAL